MIFLSALYQTILEALFPLSSAEQELFSYSPEEAYEKLPKAPAYSEPIPHVYSVFAYKDERVAKLVWNIKYKKSVRAVRIVGYAVWKALNNKASKLKEAKAGTPQDTPSSSADDAAGSPSPSLSPKRPSIAPAFASFLIVPIPITNKRRKERGYNQCELLVDEIDRLDTEKRFVIEKNLLIRTQHASRQTLKGREDRLESAKGIFEVQEITGKNKIDRKIPVVIIDDVITTGSTIMEAMQTMRDAGFENVYGLSLAH